MMVVGSALAIALVGLALYLLGKRLRKALRTLLAYLHRTAQHLGEGVQEKTESIFDWDATRQTVQARARKVLRRLRRPPRWQDLDARQRVRWVYAGWLQRHSDIAPTLTAREALRARDAAPEMADFYERARYSDTPILPEEAEQMRKAGKR